MKIKEEIQQIIDQLPRYPEGLGSAIFHLYGRVNLPHGLHTPGRDRLPTQRLIFPKSFEGLTVLDVGCAFGYWCFEAERLGAKKVVGLEILKVCLKRAALFKELKESNVEFRDTDIAQLPEIETFDYILALNVLHHVPNPTAVLSHLHSRTRKTLIVESPIEHRGVNVMSEVQRLFRHVKYIKSPIGKRRIAVCSHESPWHMQ